jgi:hypothetical protein
VRLAAPIMKPATVTGRQFCGQRNHVSSGWPYAAAGLWPFARVLVSGLVAEADRCADERGGTSGPALHGDSGIPRSGGQHLASMDAAWSVAVSVSIVKLAAGAPPRPIETFIRIPTRLTWLTPAPPCRPSR